LKSRLLLERTRIKMKYLVLLFIVMFAQSLPAQQWQQVGWEGGYLPISAQLGNTLYASSRDAIYRSTNWGKDWSLFRTGIPLNSNIYSGNTRLQLLSDEMYVYFIPATNDIDSGFYYCKEKEDHWTYQPFFKVNNEMVSTTIVPSDSILILTENSSGYFDTSHGLFLSIDSGKTWTKRNNNLPEKATRIHGLIKAGKFFFTQCQIYDVNTLSEYYQTFRTSNFGESWERMTMPLGDTNYFSYTVLPENILFATTTYYIDNSDRKNIESFRSTDFGQSWQKVFHLDINPHWGMGTPYMRGNRVLLSCSDYPEQDILFVSLDKGYSWSKVTKIFASGVIYGNTDHVLISIPPTGANNPIGNFVSDSTFILLEPLSSRGYYNNDARLLFVRKSQLFAINEEGMNPYNDWYDSVLVSYDNGTTWSQEEIPFGVQLDNKKKWVGYDKNIYASGITKDSTPCLYHSVDGKYWNIIASLPEESVAIFPEGDTLVVELATGLFLSIDAGKSWIKEDFPNGKFPGQMTYHVGTFRLFVNDSIFISTNFGKTWSDDFIHPNNIDSRGFSNIWGNKIFTYSNDSHTYYRSIGDTAWTMCKGLLPYFLGISFLYEKGILFAVGYTRSFGNSVLYYSIDSGASWKQLADYVINSDDVFIGSEYIFLAGGELWRMPKSILALLKAPLHGNISSLSLSVFPNPISTSARIYYSLPFHSEVIIQVFDLMGREVGNIQSGWQDAGLHDVEWNTKGLSSGSYILRISAAGESSARVVAIVK
jgi:hypothetical protein